MMLMNWETALLWDVSGSILFAKSCMSWTTSDCDITLQIRSVECWVCKHKGSVRHALYPSSIWTVNDSVTAELQSWEETLHYILAQFVETSQSFERLHVLYLVIAHALAVLTAAPSDLSLVLMRAWWFINMCLLNMLSVKVITSGSNPAPSGFHYNQAADKGNSFKFMNDIARRWHLSRYIHCLMCHLDIKSVLDCLDSPCNN